MFVKDVASWLKNLSKISHHRLRTRLCFLLHECAAIVIKSDTLKSKACTPDVFALVKAGYLLSQQCPHVAPAWMQQQAVLVHLNVQISVCKVSVRD